MEFLRQDIIAEMNRLDLNATGAMKASIEYDVTSDNDGTTGTLSALDYWVNVGSGTPPGTKVLVRDIQNWIDAKGIEDELESSAREIAKRIRLFGSLAYREGAPNAFETAITAWELNADTLNIGEATADAIGGEYVGIVTANLGRI